ncbi:MAG: hypothetical protein ACHQ1D_00960 [Nitrososphaerales archaeon]
MLGLVILLVIIQLAVGIFYQTLDASQVEINPFGQNTDQSRLWSFFFNPTLWTDSAFWVLISTIILTASGIAVGIIFGVRSDLTYLFGLFLFFASFGAIPVASLYMVIYSEVGIFAGCVIGQPCLPAGIIAFFFSGILGAAWIFTCIEWWSGHPMTG